MTALDADRADLVDDVADVELEAPEAPAAPACATCGAVPVGTYRDGSPRYGCGPHEPIWPAAS